MAAYHGGRFGSAGLRMLSRSRSGRIVGYTEVIDSLTQSARDQIVSASAFSPAFSAKGIASDSANRVLVLREIFQPLRSVNLASISQIMTAKIVAVETPNRSIPFAVSSGPNNLQEGVMMKSP